MSLTIPTTGGAGAGGAILSGNPTAHPYARVSIRRHVILSPAHRTSLHVASAKKFSPRSGRLNRRGGSTTTRTDQEFGEFDEGDRTAEMIRPGGGDDVAGSSAVDDVDDGYFLPKLPGGEPDFWEGEQWDGLGFFVEYLWAFGVLFALIACGIAVVTYNDGATDFKDTPVYKESMQTQEFLEENDASNPDVFESNPTEVAPSLE